MRKFVSFITWKLDFELVNNKIVSRGSMFGWKDQRMPQMDGVFINIRNRENVFIASFRLGWTFLLKIMDDLFQLGV